MFHKTNYRQFKNTLAHEMIHVKQFVTRKQADHGRSFDSEAYRINSMGLGFNITHKNNEEIGVSDQQMGNAKDLIAIIQEINGEYFLSVTTPKVYETDFDGLLEFYRKNVDKGQYRSVVVTVIQSRNPNLLSKRILRTMARSFSYSPLGDSLLEELLNDKIIKTINFKKGEPASITYSNQMAENIDDSSNWEMIEIT
jgi:hypothetical protein